MGIEKLVELAVKGEVSEEPVVEETPVAEEPITTEPEVTTEEPVVEEPKEEPAEVATSIADLTEGKFQNLEDLYADYQKLGNQEPQKYEFRDEYIQRLVERYEKGEDLTPYLKARTLKLDSMSAEDLLRMDLKEQYPDASAKDLDRLYKKHVVGKFNLDPEENDEDEISVGKIEMNKVARKIREQYEEKLKPFLQPEPLEPSIESETQEPKEVDLEQKQKEFEAQLKQFDEMVRSDKESTRLLEEKVFKIPTVDGESFNFEVDNPEELLDQAIYSDKFYKNFATENGPDLNKFFMVSKFAQDPQRFIELLVQHGKELGKAQKLQDIENPSEPERKGPTEDNSDPWQKLFKSVGG